MIILLILLYVFIAFMSAHVYKYLTRGISPYDELDQFEFSALRFLFASFWIVSIPLAVMNYLSKKIVDFFMSKLRGE